MEKCFGSDPSYDGVDSGPIILERLPQHLTFSKTACIFGIQIKHLSTSQKG